ncbi:hypothetical protein [Nostoc piscinale]|nr:hypothetical protein [Nostoc piscinale]
MEGTSLRVTLLRRYGCANTTLFMPGNPSTASSSVQRAGST